MYHTSVHANHVNLMEYDIGLRRYNTGSNHNYKYKQRDTLCALSVYDIGLRRYNTGSNHNYKYKQRDTLCALSACNLLNMVWYYLRSQDTSKESVYLRHSLQCMLRKVYKYSEIDFHVLILSTKK